MRQSREKCMQFYTSKEKNNLVMEVQGALTP